MNNVVRFTACECAQAQTELIHLRPYGSRTGRLGFESRGFVLSLWWSLSHKDCTDCTDCTVLLIRNGEGDISTRHISFTTALETVLDFSGSRTKFVPCVMYIRVTLYCGYLIILW